MQTLYEFMNAKLNTLNSPYVRYMGDRIRWDNRMLGLVGPRGVGKTTLFLQHLKSSNHMDESLYVSADNIYFAEHSLYDTANAFRKDGGRFLYIDEIHQYKECHANSR